MVRVLGKRTGWLLVSFFSFFLAFRKKELLPGNDYIIFHIHGLFKKQKRKTMQGRKTKLVYSKLGLCGRVSIAIALESRLFWIFLGHIIDNCRHSKAAGTLYVSLLKRVLYYETKILVKFFTINIPLSFPGCFWKF